MSLPTSAAVTFLSTDNGAAFAGFDLGQLLLGLACYRIDDRSRDRELLILRLQVGPLWAAVGLKIDD